MASVFQNSKEIPSKYKTSYLDHKGSWIHKCDCGYKSGLNPLTNCKCGYDQYLDIRNDRCVSWIDADLTSSINCAVRGNNSNWKKSSIGDFFNLNNPKCVMKGSGGYVSDKSKLKEKCCVSCANKFYSPTVIKDRKLYSSPTASGYHG